MRARLSLLGCLCLLAAGCSRQDTECLAGIGRKIIDHARANGESVRLKLEGDFPAAAKAPGLKEKVEGRLSWDTQLADSKIEVAVEESDVELKGTLKSDEQRRRAVELAEATVGVKGVRDRLQVADAPAP